MKSVKLEGKEIYRRYGNVTYAKRDRYEDQAALAAVAAADSAVKGDWEVHDISEVPVVVSSAAATEGDVGNTYSQPPPQTMTSQHTTTSPHLSQ